MLPSCYLSFAALLFLTFIFEISVYINYIQRQILAFRIETGLIVPQRVELSVICKNDKKPIFFCSFCIVPFI